MATNITFVDRSQSIGYGGGISINGLGGAKQLLATLADVMDGASIRAQNNLAYHIRLGEQDQMRTDLDRPTRWSLKALVYEKATATNNARVWFVDPFRAHNAGIGAEDYMGAQILGGKRTRDRRSEVLMKVSGFMAKDEVWAPALGVKEDGHGNIPGRFLSQILSNLGTIDTARTKGTLATTKFVVATKGVGGKAIGIYQVLRGGADLKPILWFIKRPTYRARYDFYGRAQREFNQRWRAELDKQVSRALENA